MSDGGLKLIDTAFGLQVIYNGRRLYGEHPIPDAQRRVSSVPMQPNTLYLVSSPAACHAIAQLCGSLLPGSAVLAVEADPVLLELAGRFWGELGLGDERARLTAATPDAINRVIGDWGIERFRRVREVSASGGSSLHRDTYRAIGERFDRDIRIAWQNRLTLTAMGRLWMRNILRNLPLARHFSAQPPATGTKPVVVCGAGPSLDDVIEWIIRVREKVIVVAADTALPALIESNIDPDAVIALEGQIANIGDFLPVQGHAYTLFADLSSVPAAVELHSAGQVVWLATEFAPLSFLRRLHDLFGSAMVLPPVGSVGIAAVLIAAHLTSGPIILAGLDLSLRPGVTHARGTAPHSTLLVSTSRTRGLGSVGFGYPLIQSRSDSGEMVSTTVAMLGYAEQLRRIVADLGRVFALSTSGLPSGAKAITLDEADRLTGSDSDAHRAGGSSPWVDHHESSKTGSDSSEDEGRQKVRFFLETESGRLAQLLCHLTDHLSGSADRSAELGVELAEADYLYVDFPDPSSHPLLETSFLRRTLIAARYYESRIGVAINSLRS